MWCGFDRLPEVLQFHPGMMTILLNAIKKATENEPADGPEAHARCAVLQSAWTSVSSVLRVASTSGETNASGCQQESTTDCEKATVFDSGRATATGSSRTLGHSSHLTGCQRSRQRRRLACFPRPAPLCSTVPGPSRAHDHRGTGFDRRQARRVQCDGAGVLVTGTAGRDRDVSASLRAGVSLTDSVVPIAP